MVEFPTSAPVTLRDTLDVGLLVSYLRSSARERPVVLLTQEPDAKVPYVSAAALNDQFGRRIDVVTLPTVQLTYNLAKSVGGEASAYRGACRVYPVGNVWEVTPYKVPLRLARDKDERRSLTARVVRDIHAALNPAPTPTPVLRPAPSPTAAPPSPKHSSRSRITAVPGPPKPVVPRPPAPRPSSTPAAGAATAHVIATPADADGLAHHLFSPQRAQPVVVITRASGADAAFVDVEQIRTDLSGLAEVVEVTTAEASWSFSTNVPDRCQVYGGASRVYPVGAEWADDPYLAPLRFAYSSVDKTDVTRRLISDAMSMAARGGLTVGAPDERPRRVAGEVAWVVAERGVVNLADGGQAVLWPELVAPDVPAERLLQAGMKVAGTLEPVSRRLNLEADRLSPEEALAMYSDGDTVLARVTKVTEAGCTVELFPGQLRTVDAMELSDDGLGITSLVAEGDVIPLWLGAMDDGEWLLSLLSAGDPADATPAPPILRGGPPWLLPQEPAVEDPAPEEPDEGPAPTDAQQREHAMLVRRLREAEHEAQTLKARLKLARDQLRQEKKKAKRRPGMSLDLEGLFATDAEQLDFEIQLAWALMTTPADKAARPLKQWSYSDHFFSTVSELNGIAREKIVEVLVHVLTGLDADLPSRERHQLRTGPGGSDPVRKRDDGATAWRVSLQVKSPSARRLHYWQKNDGSIELSSVRLHDQFDA